MKVMGVECSMCKKALEENEGLVSSDGRVVCGEDCKEQCMRVRKPALTVYSRVTGYCTPVSSWNKGKLREFKDRQKYSL